jgi:hypothetical protein
MESILITEKERIGADIDHFDSSYRLFVKYPVQLIQVRTYMRMNLHTELLTRIDFLTWIHIDLFSFFSCNFFYHHLLLLWTQMDTEEKSLSKFVILIALYLFDDFLSLIKKYHINHFRFFTFNNPLIFHLPFPYFHFRDFRPQYQYFLTRKILTE